MENLSSVFNNLDKAKRRLILAASGFAFLAISAMALINGNGPMALLYAGLEERAAGDVLKSLDQRAVPYEIRSTGIYVPTSQRDMLRMTLASEGLPAMSERGYELLDGLSGFGTTSQMFSATYWRAKEGELARTILDAPHIKSARVHISSTPTSAFQRDLRPSAAVTVSTVSGMLTNGQAQALRYVVAAAVAGLSPSDVSIIDDVAGLIASPKGANTASAGNERADALQAKVERLLSAHVGIGNAVVEIAVETVTATETITERRFDPESRVLISDNNQERSTTSENSNEGQVTVASNLPDGEAAGADGKQSARSNETRQQNNYEVSETNRQVQRSPGDIRRLSVAVLINSELPMVPGSTAATERSAAELAQLTALVSSAVGYDEARGDVITLEAMPFNVVESRGSTAGITQSSTFKEIEVMKVIQYGLGAIVALVLGLFVVRPILAQQRTETAIAGIESQAHSDPLPSIELGGSEAQEESNNLLPDLGLAPPLDFGGFDTATSFGDSDDEGPTERLKSLIAERQDETLQVLQSWLEPDGSTSESAS